jgi:hypothetical protein
MQSIESPYRVEIPQLNERLWQAWICKNRESDRAWARKRSRFLQVALGVVFVAAVVQNLAS